MESKGYGVKVLVYGSWRVQQTGLTGAQSGNIAHGMRRMGYTAESCWLGEKVVVEDATIAEMHYAEED